MDPYTLVISISLIVISSFFFNGLAKKTNIPSVLMLMVLGMVISNMIDIWNVDLGFDLQSGLNVIGIIGLIMIVLEAALDLKLSKEKTPLIFKSLIVSIVSLIATSFGIAGLIFLFFYEDTTFIQALVNSIPLSVISSAIVIPSVSSLKEEKKEFLIYESTFSDILGIMYFYFLIGNAEVQEASTVIYVVVGNILLTLVLSIIISYLLVYIFQKLKAEVKLFLIIAVLILLYAIGKKFKLSPLFLILMFGLILNNTQIFFRGKMRRLLDEDSVNKVLKEFHLLTLETSFLVRTMFFVIFGMTITISSLFNLFYFTVGLSLVGAIYLIRWVSLKAIYGKQILPELFISPRGLITILLFFAIPKSYGIETFTGSILLYVIIFTGVAMTASLIAARKKEGLKEELAKDSIKPAESSEKSENDLDPPEVDIH